MIFLIALNIKLLHSIPADSFIVGAVINHRNRNNLYTILSRLFAIIVSRIYRLEQIYIMTSLNSVLNSVFPYLLLTAG
jgi:hypothetical protein